MSRAKYTGTAVTLAADGRSLQIIPNASVTLYTAGTSTPLPETVYAGNTGGTTLTPPFQTDAYGAFEFYLASGKRVKVTVSDGVNTVTMDLEPVLPDPSELVTTAGGVTIPNLTLTSPTINGGTLNSVTLVTPSGVVTPSSSDTLTNKTIQGADIQASIIAASAIKGGPIQDVRAFGTITSASILAATATATIGTGGSAGQITAIIPDSGGPYYARVPIVYISGDGTGATAHAVLTGNQVTSYVVDTPGSGYTTVTVTVDGAWYTSPDAINANTAAVQAAMTAAAAGGVNSSREVWIPDTVIQTNQLDGSNVPNGIKFRGASAQSSRLVPGIAVHGEVWIDLSGGAGHGWYNVGVGDTANPCEPTVGVLYGNTDDSGNASNVHDGYAWRMDGFYSVAGVYAPHFNSSQFFNCSWSNSYVGGGAAAMYLTYQNAEGIASPFATLSSTPAGITTNSFFGCEFHGDGRGAGNYAFRGENIAGIRFNGCHLSASSAATAQIRLDTDATPGPAAGSCSWLTFDNTHIYTEVSTPPAYGIYISNADSTGVIDTLILNGGAINAGTALIRAEASTTIKRLVTQGNIDGGAAAAILSPASGNLTLEDPEIDCCGLNLSVGASGTISRGHLNNHGTLTFGTCTAERTASNGAKTFGGSITATTGTFGGSITATTGTFGGSITATTGTFTTAVRAGSATVATVGAFRGPKNSGLYGLTNGGGDMRLIAINSSDNIDIGETSNVATTTMNAQHAVQLVIGAGTRFKGDANGVAVNGATPAAPPSLGSAAGATYTAAEQTLLNNLRSWAIASGWCTA